MSLFIEHVTLDESFDHESVNFQLKILEKSGFGSETCIPPSMSRLPLTKSSTFDEEEAKTIIFSIIKELFEKNSVNPKTIDILIINSSMFSPTPSLSAMVVNKFGLRSNIMSYNLSGMGCSAGLISVDLAKDLLRVHRNSLALIVSTEILTLNWYNGKKRSMLLTNCLFRMGGVTLLMSSRDRDKKGAKYVLQHLIRTHKAREDRSYNCVFQDLDSEDKVGVSLSKDILHIAGDALKANIASLGPLVLPFTEQLRYGISIICRKTHVWGRKTSIYIPNFQRAFEHFCIHAGGRAVIHAIETNLRLSKEDVEASKMTLYRFGNTSSSSVWYELCYIEAKQRVKRGDRVWQIAFGSGFKCNSAVWKRVSDIDPKIENAWTDRIHSYPVDVPNVVKLTD
ncbi:hypothetical protein GIB67_033196 [Kingdonia uniflora]|uniref:very-long-chain 3-oxoacyl-CoA synthase n=1 Tax=Kingdonia uniflora TaxID=39325 RepID=A0A7J7MPI6_9MAGN|nr:hypothetical protein GIB67_033196 [Kingdonia uniflora]